MAQSGLFPSVMRTLVPAAAGLVLGAAARVGLDVDDAAVTGYVTAAATAAYYGLFRGLEHLAGKLRWTPLQQVAGALLGWARPPQYPTPEGPGPRPL